MQMNPYTRFFLGTPVRVLSTLLGCLAIWGIADPESARSFVVGCWNNFWHAFGPILEQLFVLAIVCVGVRIILAGFSKKGK
jgi:hypothetical protein